MSENIPNLRAVAKTFVENGAVYVAVNEQSLIDEPVQLYYHLPVGVSDDKREEILTYVTENIGFRPADGQLGVIKIADQTTPIAIAHVLRGDLHRYRRVPVAVTKGVSGLDPVAIDDGVRQVRDVATSDVTPTSPPAKTIRLKELVEELAATGAASVELAREYLVTPNEPVVFLRIPMIPAKGEPIVGPVETVEVNGETYPLRYEFTLDGPYGSSDVGWTALYVSDNVHGLAPLSVEKGLENGRELLNRAKDAESHRDLEPLP